MDGWTSEEFADYISGIFDRAFQELDGDEFGRLLDSVQNIIAYHYWGENNDNDEEEYLW